MPGAPFRQCRTFPAGGAALQPTATDRVHWHGAHPSHGAVAVPLTATLAATLDGALPSALLFDHGVLPLRCRSSTGTGDAGRCGRGGTDGDGRLRGRFLEHSGFSAT